jgi:hypothetical protein
MSNELEMMWKTQMMGLFCGANPLLDQGLLIIETSRSHSDTPHSVGLPWKSDQSEAETFTLQHNTHKTDIHAPDGIRTPNPASVRPQTHVDRAATGWLALLFGIYPEWLRKYKKSSVQSISHPWYESHIFEDGTVRLSRNVCRELPLFAA